MNHFRRIRMLEGRVAIVTGASGGIGKAICATLAREGADLVVHYLHGRAGAELAEAAVRVEGRKAEVVRADVAVGAEARALVSRAMERFGRLDILVNAAGVYPRSWAMEMAEEEWDTVLDINLKGTFLCSQAAARVMKQAGAGAIVNTSSIAIRGQARGAHYCASKAGVVALTRVLALEWAPEIRVNCIAPGLTDTDMPRKGMSQEEIANRVQGMPLPRLGRPEDIARAVLFLVSDNSSWVTGQTVHVNGGDWMP